MFPSRAKSKFANMGEHRSDAPPAQIGIAPDDVPSLRDVTLRGAIPIWTTGEHQIHALPCSEIYYFVENSLREPLGGLFRSKIASTQALPPSRRRSLPIFAEDRIVLVGKRPQGGNFRALRSARR